MGQFGLGIAGDRNQFGAHAAKHSQHRDQFLGLPRVGNGNDHVLLGNHAQVAVQGFGSVHEKSGSAGRGQGSRDLARYVAGLAYAGHHHTALTVHEQFGGFYKTLVQTPAQRL